MNALVEAIQNILGDKIISVTDADMPTIIVTKEKLIIVCQLLRDHPELQFDMLVDVCGVDYLQHGLSEWRTDETTRSGFSRGVSENPVIVHPWKHARFASVYHLLSIQKNHRVRIKVFLEEDPITPSVFDLWKSADWFERESYDLFGIVYEGHPDLRRILTDYGFHGHPFRKDFPLIGEVEMRYDAKQARCVYEPVSIESRTTVPKVIREDNRYE